MFEIHIIEVREALLAHFDLKPLYEMTVRSIMRGTGQTCSSGDLEERVIRSWERHPVPQIQRRPTLWRLQWRRATPEGPGMPTIGFSIP